MDEKQNNETRPPAKRRRRSPLANIERDRIIMFSDGVFAIVLTLLVLEITAGHGNAWHDLKEALPELGVFAWSFFLGLRFWVLHVRLFGALKGKIPEDFADTNGVLLFFVALLPFSTKFFSDHFHQTWGAVVYAVVIGMIGFMQARMRARILQHAGKDDKSEEVQAVRDAWPYIVIPSFMALSVPFAFLSAVIAYAVWALFILVNIIRAVVIRLRFGRAGNSF